MPATSEPEVNIALGEVLRDLRPGSWTVRTEPIGAISGSGKRPDIIVEDASGWPVAVEAEWDPAATVDDDAFLRIGLELSSGGLAIETAIPVIYPLELDGLSGEPLRDAIRGTGNLQFALYAHRPNEPAERLPSSGYVRGGARDLAMLIQRAATPVARVDALADELERGVEDAAGQFTKINPFGGPAGRALTGIIGQADDPAGQSRRMAMTIITNALIFHSALASAGFTVRNDDHDRVVMAPRAFRHGGHFSPTDISDEWDRILERNYYPIFWSAREMLATMPAMVAASVLDRLWRTAERLIAGGMTRSHDLTGVIFQRLIADRKFLATFYTRPAAAALLAGIALPPKQAPGGADWGDADTLASMQIGDFACGTGTLLSAAYQRISLLHELHGGDPEELHGPMMQHGLVGLDVLTSAVHLTATMLAGSHPATPFEGECLLTMPYGPQTDGSVAIGALSLLSDEPQLALLGAAAKTAGGRSSREVRDLVGRVGHEKFDLAIMNPPFTRPTALEGEKQIEANIAFAAFGTTREQQDRMNSQLKQLRGNDPIGSGYAGLASDFLDLAMRKIRPGGTIAFVLPQSALIGKAWERVRKQIAKRFGRIVIVTIAGATGHASSFSADTGMAECLLIASGPLCNPATPRATCIVLRSRPASAVEAQLLADQINAQIEAGTVRTFEEGRGASLLRLGAAVYGQMVDAPLVDHGGWPIAGITDIENAQVADQLERQELKRIGPHQFDTSGLSMTRLGELAERGPYDRDIHSDYPDGTPRGPFELIRPPVNPQPSYPILWTHHADQERNLVVQYDAEGMVKSHPAIQDAINAKAVRIWETAAHAHYNRDMQFNSQSLALAMTERPCIGGRAWPTLKLDNPDGEFFLSLWCNSTLGLLLHWWHANKAQGGRGTIPLTGLPDLRVPDLRRLAKTQIDAARTAFEDLKHYPFLPFDQIDEDVCRHELDRRLLVDILGFPPETCEPGGAIDILRRKLAAEPQIHGGKKSRIEFVDPDDETPINPAPAPPPPGTPINCIERKTAR